MTNHTISGSGGVALHISEHGDSGGKPILLIHGWSQSELCWTKQYQASELSGFRLLGLDLRGHGMSGHPTAAEDYSDGDKWADDIAAVIAELDLERPILVGWSYAGFVISDYLRKHGGNGIGGINLVAAAVILRPDAFGTLIGPGFLEHAPTACSSDLSESIPAVRAFLRACTAVPLSAEDYETCLAFNMVVPHWVRGFLVQRELDFSAVLRDCNLPLKLTHGRADNVVLPAMTEHILGQYSDAKVSWYDDVGHAPFLERPERFNRELADFANSV
jgi:pimeloyl-ACP methyl ester carboxylesterase